MTDPQFDPYYQWLGIPPSDQPADHYRLLSIRQFEHNATVIENAADRQMAHVRKFQMSQQHRRESQQLLNELSRARVVLLNPQQKAAYDAELTHALPAPAPPALPSQGPPALPPQKEEGLADLPSPGSQPASVGLHRNEPTRIVTGRRLRHNNSSPLALLIKLGGIALGIVTLGALGLLLMVVVFEQDPLGIRREQPLAELGEPPLRTPLDQGNAPGKEASPKPRSGASPKTPDATPRTKGLRSPAVKRSSAAKRSDTREQQSNERISEPAASTYGTRPSVSTLGNQISSDRSSKLLTVPSQSAQAGAISVIQEVYQTDLSRIEAAKSPQREALLKRLAEDLLTAAKTEEDATTRYVLLCQARDRGFESFSGPPTFAAIDQLAAGYQIDSLEMRSQVLQDWSQRRPPNGWNIDIRLALAAKNQECAKLAFDADRLDIAERLLALARRQARLAKRPDLAKDFGEKLAQVKAFKPLLESVRQAEQVLAQTPNDEGAHLTVGRYYAFSRRNWKQGLPHLAKSPAGPLREAALRDLNRPFSPSSTAQLEMGDLWWDAGRAMKQAGDELPASAQARAVFWYKAAIAGLTGTDRVRIERRLLQMSNLPKGTVLAVNFDDIFVNTSSRGSQAKEPGVFDLVAGVSGQGARLSRSSPIVFQNVALPSGNAARTIMFWMQYYLRGGRIIPFHYGEHLPLDACYLMIFPSGELFLGNANGGPLEVTTRTRLVDEQWYHVALVHDGRQTTQVYVNGKLMAKRNAQYRTSPSNRLFVNSFAGNVGFGAIDDLLVVSRSLSPTEIRQLMKTGLGATIGTGSTSSR